MSNLKDVQEATENLGPEQVQKLVEFLENQRSLKDQEGQQQSDDIQSLSSFIDQLKAAQVKYTDEDNPVHG